MHKQYNIDYESADLTVYPPPPSQKISRMGNEYYNYMCTSVKLCKHY